MALRTLYIKYLRRQGINTFKCNYCNLALTEKTATVDHVFPASKGGSNDFSNLTLSCFVCNSIVKGTRTSEEIDFTKFKLYRQYALMFRALEKNNKLVKSSKKIYLI